MFWGFGNRVFGSTQMGVTVNPTTATLCAEVDFNGTNASARSGGEQVRVTWIVGAQTTLATFVLEHTLSTGMDMTTAASDTRTACAIPVLISSGQSAQFVTGHTVNPGDRFRVRIASSFTGGVTAYIGAEKMV